MEKVLASWPFRTERRRDVILVLLWAVSIASIFAQAVFQRTTLTLYDLAILFVICVAAGAITRDFAKALFGYVGAMFIGMVILFLFTMIPVFTGEVSPQGEQFLVATWLAIIIQQAFPVPTILLFIGSMVGVGLAEHYWY